VLQTQVLRVEQVDELHIGVNIKELDRELCTGLSTLYTTTHGPCYSIFSLP